MVIFLAILEIYSVQEFFIFERVKDTCEQARELNYKFVNVNRFNIRNNGQSF